MSKQNPTPPRPLTAAEMQQAAGGGGGPAGIQVPIKVKHNV